ncbi:MAG: hypothetical protein Q8920_08455 [Bacillota bacterium]|nr:hypothetical protein [Bacillota bacterium]
MKKVLFILTTILLAIILIPFLVIFELPVKSAARHDYKVIKPVSITDSDKVLICRYSDGPEPRWEVVGNKDGLFDLSQLNIESIVVEGNFQYRELNYDLLNSEDNKFILKGNFIGEKDYGYGTYKIFKVDKWDISYPIKQPLGFLPKGKLVKFDYWFRE